MDSVPRLEELIMAGGRVVRHINSRPSLDSEDRDPLTVESFDNHIYFYSQVTSDRALALMKEVRELDNHLRNEHGSRNLGPNHPQTPIWLHIQSGGGDIFSGLSLADQLAQIQTPIYSIVEGFCASAGTLISMSCTKRYIQPSAFMLIHQLSSASWGTKTYQQEKDDMHLSDMLMELLYNFYDRKTKIDKEEIKTLLSRDSWFNSNECLQNGLVDEIMGK